MIKIAICDDDVSVLNEVDELLKRYCIKRNPEIECAFFHSPLELLAEAERNVRWDVLFLDVIMPGENGISVAKEIRQYDDNVKIIFLTSSSEFAVESYKVAAYFYQIKPICEEAFGKLMDEIVSECEKAQRYGLVLRCKSGITRVSLGKLMYCEVMGHTLLFHLENGKVLESTGKMDELCAKLEQYDNFVRPHRSFLINMEYIQNISYKAVMMDDLIEIPIPHGKFSEIKKRYIEYAFSRKQVIIL